MHNDSGNERIWDTSAGEMRGEMCESQCVPPFFLLNRRIHSYFSVDRLYQLQSPAECFSSIVCFFESPLEMIDIECEIRMCLTKASSVC